MRGLIALFIGLLLVPGTLAACDIPDNTTISAIANSSNVSMATAYAFFSALCPTSQQTYTRGEVDVLINSTKQYANERIDALNFTGQVDARIETKFEAFQANITDFIFERKNQTELLAALVDVANQSNREAAQSALMDQKVQSLEGRLEQRYLSTGQYNTDKAAAASKTVDYTPYIIIAAAIGGGLLIWKRRDLRLPMRNAAVVSSASAVGLQSEGSPSVLDDQELEEFYAYQAEKARKAKEAGDAMTKEEAKRLALRRQRKQ